MSGTTGAASVGAGSSARKLALRQICVGDEMQKFYERWYASCLAPRRKQVVCKMQFIVIPAVVLPEEDLDVMPCAQDGIGVGPGLRINEVDAAVDGAMRVTLRTEIAVRT